ncbi:Uncharacterised protein [Vibrio cholerae]|nr:Uncharacterised protein [Vibrio cholerae]CRZ61050.1 Uncharacterised protein [Vibrio cholerae]CRZ63370.1 Uncharacterised protein [Vibrio cholerae]CRZ67772.1 Uncharacterised protein [Vibrio cholerae]CRZ73353.1 Uncharacterised protein [Vibrio cholerae]
MATTAEHFALADHQNMDASNAIFLCKTEHIQVFQTVVRHKLLLLYAANGLNLVTRFSGIFKTQFTARLLHFLNQNRQYLVVFALQEKT